jgi:hypothetical protein
MHEQVRSGIASLEGLFFSFALDQCLQHSRAGHHYFSLWRRISLLAARDQFGLFFAMHDPGDKTFGHLPEKPHANRSNCTPASGSNDVAKKPNRVNSQAALPIATKRLRLRWQP